MIERKDKKLDFGTFTLASSTTFENSLDNENGQVDGMGIEFTITTAATGGTNWTPKIQGSTDGSSWSDLVAGAASTTFAKGTKITLYVPRKTSVRYIRPNLAKTGTFTAGVVSAAMDCYAKD